jgi:2-hydroxy-3-keto-5-methylthiopentenyl-1-phosphate phosphatase
MVMDAFAPDGWQAITADIMAGKTTIRHGMAQVFATIPSAQRHAMEAFVATHVQLRAGFTQFAQACRQQAIPLVVVSGGLDCFIQPVLKRLPTADYNHIQLFCNVADFAQDTIRVLTPHENLACNNCHPMPVGCGCCKVSVVNQWPASRYHRVGVGDSITDLAMAHTVETLFARDRLALYCDQQGLAYQPFETFADGLLQLTTVGRG